MHRVVVKLQGEGIIAVTYARNYDSSDYLLSRGETECSSPSPPPAKLLIAKRGNKPAAFLKYKFNAAKESTHTGQQINGAINRRAYISRAHVYPRAREVTAAQARATFRRR